jgi:hypothetical protein
MSDHVSVVDCASEPQNGLMFGTARKRGASSVSSCDEAASRFVLICSRGALTQRFGGMAVRSVAGRESPACDTAIVGTWPGPHVRR